MKSARHGQATSAPAVEIMNISARGVWVYVAGEEHFLPHAEFPWFQDATVAAICDVDLIHDDHLHWPQLDVDLHLDSIRDPAAYPLTAKSEVTGEQS